MQLWSASLSNPWVVLRDFPRKQRTVRHHLHDQVAHSALQQLTGKQERGREVCMVQLAIPFVLEHPRNPRFERRQPCRRYLGSPQQQECGIGQRAILQDPRLVQKRAHVPCDRLVCERGILDEKLLAGLFDRVRMESGMEVGRRSVRANFARPVPPQVPECPLLLRVLAELCLAGPDSDERRNCGN